MPNLCHLCYWHAKLKLHDIDNGIEQELQVIGLHSKLYLTARLLIRWSRVRISPDPPVIQKPLEKSRGFFLRTLAQPSKYK